MSAGIAHLRRLLDEAGRADEPFTVGARSGALYVGEPRWDVGRAVHGSPEQVAGFLRVLAGLGVDQIEVAFRSRDVHELYDQIRLFGAEVAPLWSDRRSDEAEAAVDREHLARHVAGRVRQQEARRPRPPPRRCPAGRAARACDPATAGPASRRGPSACR